MSDPIIPDAVRTAAKRGFVRTTYQALAATLTTGISATVVLGVVAGQVEIIPTVVTLGVALVSPFIAGAASYLSITANGIPGDYVPAAVGQQIQMSVVNPVVRDLLAEQWDATKRDQAGV